MAASVSRERAGGVQRINLSCGTLSVPLALALLGNSQLPDRGGRQRDSAIPYSQ
jgi:hypothetical protein